MKVERGKRGIALRDALRSIPVPLAFGLLEVYYV
jgi:hypothetical protein